MNYNKRAMMYLEKFKKAIFITCNNKKGDAKDFNINSYNKNLKELSLEECEEHAMFIINNDPELKELLKILNFTKIEFSEEYSTIGKRNIINVQLKYNNRFGEESWLQQVLGLRSETIHDYGLRYAIKNHLNDYKSWLRNEYGEEVSIYLSRELKKKEFLKECD